MHARRWWWLVGALVGCRDTEDRADKEPPVVATVAPGAPKSAAPCTSAVTPPPKLGTTKVKVRGYTASVDGVRFFLEPKGAGKAPFEVEAASLPMQSLLVSAFESKSEIEVAVDPSGCVPRVMFLRAP